MDNSIAREKELEESSRSPPPGALLALVTVGLALAGGGPPGEQKGASPFHSDTVIGAFVDYVNPSVVGVPPVRDPSENAGIFKVFRMGPFVSRWASSPASIMAMISLLMAYLPPG